MKFFLKRLNNKKGFTLIELIVVIAILAILALIAVPRFAGYTDKAKISADDQYAALVANAVRVLIADNTFSEGGSVDIANDGTVSEGDDAFGNPTTFDVAEVEKLVTKKALQTNGTYDEIVVAADGTITMPEISNP